MSNSPLSDPPAPRDPAEPQLASASPEAAAAPPLPPVSEMDVEELYAALRNVRQTVNLALVGLIVVLASVNVILLQQIALLRGQVVELNRNSQQMIQFLEDHRTNGAPQFVAFIKEMRKFADRDPQFGRIMARFPQFQIPGPPTNQPPATFHPSPDGQPVRF